MSEELLHRNLDKRVSEKISTSIIEFIIKDQLTFYGYFLQNVNFYQTKSLKTAGVNFRGLRMNFYYNPEFVESLNLKQVKFLCIHELFHLLFNHPKRGHGYIHSLANIAMDMIINEIIQEKYCVDSKKDTTKKAVAEFIPDCVNMDSHYKGERIFELLYTWLNEKHLEWKQKYGEENKKNILDEISKDDNDSETCDNKSDDDEPISEERKKQNEELGIDEDTRRMFENRMPSFDTHFWDDIDDDLKDQIIKKHIETLRGRGFISSDSEEILGRLIKKKNNDILKLLKRSISSLKGFFKTSSHRKPSRKDIEGLKGKVKYASVINCILDTSGSMMGSFELVLSEIFKDDYQINMIQCDAEVKSYFTISHKRQLQGMKINGLGGTTLQPGIDFVSSNKKINGNNLVILTDGATDTLDFTKFNSRKVLIITCGEPSPLTKKFSNVTQVKIDKKDFKTKNI